MANDIDFPDPEPRYAVDPDGLSFRARVGGKPIECLVTAELLLARFGACDVTEEAMRQAFFEHKGEIRQIARDHIANGWIDEDGRLFLTTRFTRLKVVFGERLVGRTLANDANRMLTEIIGPYAEEVLVEWDGQASTPNQEGISLRIADPTISFAVKELLGPGEWKDPTMLRVGLATVWGKVLRARSRKLLLNMG
jgi:hypothetical protein